MVHSWSKCTQEGTVVRQERTINFVTSEAVQAVQTAPARCRQMYGVV